MGVSGIMQNGNGKMLLINVEHKPTYSKYKLTPEVNLELKDGKNLSSKYFVHLYKGIYYVHNIPVCEPTFIVANLNKGDVLCLSCINNKLRRYTDIEYEVRGNRAKNHVCKLNLTKDENYFISIQVDINSSGLPVFFIEPTNIADSEVQGIIDKYKDRIGKDKQGGQTFKQSAAGITVIDTPTLPIFDDSDDIKEEGKEGVSEVVNERQINELPSDSNIPTDAEIERAKTYKAPDASEYVNNVSQTNKDEVVFTKEELLKQQEEFGKFVGNVIDTMNEKIRNGATSVEEIIDEIKKDEEAKTKQVVNDIHENYDDSIIVPELKLNPFDYQNKGIKFMINSVNANGFALNADDVGLGKTIQTIGTLKWFIENKGFTHILIVCRKSIKNQWADELRKFTDLIKDPNGKDLYAEYNKFDVFITTEKKKEKLEAYEHFTKSRKAFLITNYHNYLNDGEQMIKDAPIDMCVIDEVHSIKGQNTKMNLAISSVTEGKPTILLTGTPIVSRVKDLFGIFQLANQRYLGNWDTFRDKYLIMSNNSYGEEAVGYKDLEGIRNLVQNVMIRRKADEVSIELPEINMNQINCEMDSTQLTLLTNLETIRHNTMERITDLRAKHELTAEELNQLNKYENILKGLISVEQFIADDPAMIMNEREGITGAVISTVKRNANGLPVVDEHGNPVRESLIPKAYKGSIKTEATVDKVMEIVDSGEKVIIFTRYTTAVNLLYNRLHVSKGKSKNEDKLIKVLKYTGEENQEERNKVYKLFTEDDDYQILIGTEAMAEGLNLQIAKYLINYDQPTSAAVKVQRIGRIRRAKSNHSSVFVYDMISKSSETLVINTKFGEIEKECITKDEKCLETIGSHEKLVNDVIELKQENSDIPTVESKNTYVISDEYKFVKTLDSRDNKDLYVIRFGDIGDAKFEEYKRIFKEANGYYSKYSNGFVFYNDPREFINCIDKEPEWEEPPKIEIIGKFKLIEDVDTRDNSKIYVAKIIDRVPPNTFIGIKNRISRIGGYYSKFKGGFIFKERPQGLEEI